MFKHYVRTNSGGEVIAAFSTGFQDPQSGDLLLYTTEQRHFNLDLTVEGVARYVIKAGKLVERTAAEIEALAAPLRERTAALGRLVELDAIVPRSVEDLYVATGKQPHAKVAEAIAEKQALRAKLNQGG